jgi:hypothetical protein
MICSKCLNAPVTTLQILLSALMPSLAASAPKGSGGLVLGLGSGGCVTIAQGVSAASIHAMYFESSDRTKVLYMDPGVSLFLRTSRQSYATFQFDVLGVSIPCTVGSVKITG